MLHGVLGRHGHTGEHGGEQGEDESLDEGHDALQQAHEDIEDEGDDGHAVAQPDAHATEDEDERDDAEGDDVAGGDVGEESHHQHEGLGEDTDDFHKGHQRDGDLEEPRHTGRVDEVLPVVGVGGEGGDEEGDEGEHAGDGDVAGEVGAARENRDEAHQVINKNEEEEREQIGEVFLVASLAEGGDGHLVADEEDERFHESLQPTRGFVLALLVLFGHLQEYPENQNDRDEKRTDVLGDGDVDDGAGGFLVHQFGKRLGVVFGDVFLGKDVGQRTGVVGVLTGKFHDFSLVILCKTEGIAFVNLMAMLELAGHEHVEPVVDEDDGQRDGDGLLAFADDVPAVAVDDVLDDEGAGVEGRGGFFRVFGLGGGSVGLIFFCRECAVGSKYREKCDGESDE